MNFGTSSWPSMKSPSTGSQLISMELFCTSRTKNRQIGRKEDFTRNVQICRSESLEFDEVLSLVKLLVKELLRWETRQKVTGEPHKPASVTMNVVSYFVYSFIYTDVHWCTYSPDCAFKTCAGNKFSASSIEKFTQPSQIFPSQIFWL